MAKEYRNDITRNAIRVAVLVDGGFFTKRMKKLHPHLTTAEQYANALESGIQKSIGGNYLYRVLYYDCKPHYVNHQFRHRYYNGPIDLSKSNQAQFQHELFEQLKSRRKFALRLGELQHKGWQIGHGAAGKLMKGAKKELEVGDVIPNFVQKGIDMKIGVDVASLTLKKLVDKIVLISGDSDFVPAAKLARREGVDFVLDPMEMDISPELNEHIDGIFSCLRFVNDGRSNKRRRNRRKS